MVGDEKFHGHKLILSGNSNDFEYFIENVNRPIKFQRKVVILRACLEETSRRVMHAL